MYVPADRLPEVEKGSTRALARADASLKLNLDAQAAAKEDVEVRTTGGDVWILRIFRLLRIFPRLVFCFINVELCE